MNAVGRHRRKASQKKAPSPETSGLKRLSLFTIENNYIFTTKRLYTLSGIWIANTYVPGANDVTSISE
jgi:hypothetical protein